MSNFLSNLADRSLGKAEAVLPRLPSLFEPLRSAGLPVFDAPPLEAQETREAPPARSFRQPLETPPQASAREPMAPMPRIEERAVAPEGTAEDGPPRTAKPLRVEIPRVMPTNPATPKTQITPAPKMETPRVSSELESRRDTTLPLRPVIHAPAGAVSNPQKAPIAPSMGLPLIEARVVTSEKPANRQDLQPRFRRWNDPEIRPARPERSAPVPMPVLIPKIMPRAEGPGRDGAPPRSRPEESVISVTIGRIEVRAVSTQTAMPKEKPASPVMSLSDYLRQRSKRGDA